MKTYSVEELIGGSGGAPVEVGSAELGFRFERLRSGRSQGVDRVTLRCGDNTLAVVPTRGMGIAYAESSNSRFGWDSPVSGPVHPAFVPILRPDGLGWLEGFDELLVRCGMASNGPPVFNDAGQLVHPLHGRMANLPAQDVTVEVDGANETVTIRGTVIEACFLFQRLRLEAEITLSCEAPQVRVCDRIVNDSSHETTAQMLYHVNFGRPILDGGTQVFAPVQELVPRDTTAAEGVAGWSTYNDPTPGFAEQVYFMTLAGNDSNETLVCLANAARSRGIALGFNTEQLPCFTLWKNTAAESDGYVTGLEPGVNFPNARSQEEAQGRVLRLKTGESATMALDMYLLNDGREVDAMVSRVSALAGGSARIHEQPQPGW